LELRLEKVGKTVFSITPSWKDKCILLTWGSHTEVPNIVWVKVTCIKLGWPFIKTVKFFT